MQKILLLLMSGSLLMVGCGKKQDIVSVSKKAKIKNVASLNNGEIPLLLTENQSLLDVDAENEFAFVDAEESFFEDENKGAVIAATDANKGKKKFTIDMAKEDRADQSLAANLELDDETDFDRVQFNFNKNDIRKDQAVKVKKDVALAKKAIQEGKEVIIAGHTCQMGSAAYNIALSQKRAEVVKSEMLKAGLPSDRIKTLGLGYESPLVSSDATTRTEKIKDLAPNRRAEINLA